MSFSKLLSTAAFTAVSLGFSGYALQVQGQDIPSTLQPGSMEQEFRPVDPELNRDNIVLPLPSSSGLPDGVADVRFTLNELMLDGNSVLNSSELRSFYSDLLGRDISLSQVFAVAGKITAHYAEAGYALAVAYVPAQEIEEGRVRISIVEGYVAEVNVVSDDGSMQGHVGQGETISNRTNAIMADTPLTSEVLERELLLLNDLPGVTVRAVLDRSQIDVGGTALLLDVETNSVEGNVGFNNRGSKALGPSRFDVSIAFNNFITTGGQLALSTVRTSSSSDLEHYGMQTRLPVSGSDLEFYGNLSWTDSKPGLADLRTLEFASDGLAAGIGLRYPLQRSRNQNVMLSGGLRMQNSTSDFLSVANSQDKTRAFDASLSYDHLNDRGAFTSISVTLTKGLGIFDATANDDPLKSRFDADFTGSKVDMSMFYLTPLANGLSMQFHANVQNAFDPLPAAEQCGYGGASFGRGFDNFELAGDSCFLGSFELQKTWHQGDGDNYLQLYGFADIGAVKLKGIVEAPEVSNSSATSLGLGVRFHVFRYFNVNLEYARPMERDVRMEGNRKSRLFFNLSASF